MSYNAPLTLEIVKAELGITTTTNDAKITAKLPYSEAKFRQVAGYDFNVVFTVIYESGSNKIKVIAGVNTDIDFMKYGDLILSDNHADGTYIIGNSKVETDSLGYYEITVSTNATADSNDGGSDIILCYNIIHFAVLSQLVWFMISENDVEKVGEKDVSSQSMGGVSVSFAGGSNGAINQRYGLPNKIVQQIPKYASAY